MEATTAMGERARRRGGRRVAEDDDGRGWEAAAREGLRIGLGHLEGCKCRAPPSLAAHRTAGMSRAERMDPAHALIPAFFSPAEQAVQS
jgi:hypothetical protein